MKKLLLPIILVLSVFTGACAAVTDVGMRKPPTYYVNQRNEHDCAVAAVAMAADTSYDEVEKHLDQMHITYMPAGMYIMDIIKLAASLGVNLRASKEVNFVSAQGIVVVETDQGTVHAVYVQDGLIYDPGNSGPSPYVMEKVHWRQTLFYLRRINEPNPDDASVYTSLELTYLKQRLIK